MSGAERSVDAAIGMGAGAATGAMIGNVPGAIVGAVIGGIGGWEASGQIAEANEGEVTDRNRSVSVNARDPRVSRRVAYGKTKIKNCPITWFFEDSQNRLHLTHVICEGPIESIEQVFFDDEEVDLSAAAAGPVEDKSKIVNRLGGANQSAVSDAVNADPNFTSSHTGNNIACLYSRLDFDPDVFRRIPKVDVVVKGKNDIRDPRTGTTGYTDNPALCVADFLTNSRYGFGDDEANIRDADLTTAANTCEESVSLGSGSQQRYVCNGTFSTSENMGDTLNNLTAVMAGQAIWTEGEWVIRAGEFVTPTTTIDEGDLRGGIEVKTGQNRRNLFNAVRGTYQSEENGYSTTDFPAWTDSTYLDEDDGERMWKDIQLPFTTNAIRAQRLAKINLEIARQQISVNMPCKVTILENEAGEDVSVDNTRFGWSGKSFRIQRMEFSQTAAEGAPAIGVDTTLREISSTAYDWNAGDETVIDSAPDTNLADPFVIERPSNMALASGTDQLLTKPDGTIVERIRVTWDSHPSNYVKQGGFIQVQAKKSADTDWEDQGQADGDATQFFISPVEAGVDYDVRIRAITGRARRRSDWRQVSDHTVVGKTEKPPNVTKFHVTQNGDQVQMRWRDVRIEDLRGYEIRIARAGTTTYERASVFTEVPSGTTIVTTELAPKTYDFWIKAVDTSGNRSEAANRVTREVKNTFDIINEQQEDPFWLGTLRDMIKHHTGVLVPTDENLASDYDNFDLFNNYVNSPAGGSLSAGEEQSPQWLPNVEFTGLVKHHTGVLVPKNKKKADQYNNYEVFDQYVPDAVDLSRYEAPEHDLTTDVNVNIFAEVTADAGPGEVGDVDVTHMVDHRTEGGSYDGFEDWESDTVQARFVKHRLKVTNNGAVPVIEKFRPQSVAETVSIYETAEVDLLFSDTVRAWGDVTGELGPGETGKFDASVQLDSRDQGGQFDGFENWNKGEKEGRFFKFRFLLDNSDGSGRVDEFRHVEDLLERTEKDNNVSISSSGTSITFDDQFHFLPTIEVTVNSSSSAIAVIQSVSTTGFDIHVFDTDGVEIGGNVDWFAVGI